MHADAGGAGQGKVHIATFGGLRVTGNGVDVGSFETRKARSLLARLALSTRPMTREALASFLWPEDLEESTRPRLRTELHRLKSLLAPAGEVLLISRDSVAVDRRLCTVDFEAFEKHLRRARFQDGDRETLASYESALANADGDWLPHETDEWFFAERERIDEMRGTALRDASVVAERLGDLTLATSLARRAVVLQPIGTDSILRLLDVLSAADDVAGAVSAFDAYESRLERDLQLGADHRVKARIEEVRSGKRRPQPATPPIAAPAAEPGPFPPLPRVSTNVVGRESALAHLSALLLPMMEKTSRLLTVVGPGGVGKTTLAILAARDLLGDYRGRVAFVDLTSARQGAQVVSRILDAIGSGDSGEQLSNLAKRLGPKPVLLVLDNLEQIPDVADALAEVLDQASMLHVLATSRRALGLQGEQRFPLDPLVAPIIIGTKAEYEAIPAVRLYLEQVRLRLPAYDPDEAELRSIIKLIERLDGLPLGIMLAAAQGHVFTPKEMLAELQDDPAWLKADSKGAEERHRGIALTFEWSLSHLDDAARTHLYDLAVFEGGWNLSAAREVCGRDVLDSLAQLVDHSLVMRRESPAGSRYSILPLFRELLKREASDDLAGRHANWALNCVRAAHQVREQNGTEYIVRITQEISNIEAAIEWCWSKAPEECTEFLASVWLYWYTRWGGPGPHRIADWLAHDPPGEPRFIAECWLGLSMLVSKRGDRHEAAAHAEKAAELFQELDDRHGVLAARRAQAFLPYQRMEFAEAERLWRVLIPQAVEIESWNAAGSAFVNLGLSLAHLDRGEEAIDALMEGIRIRGRMNDPTRTLWARHSLGTAQIAMRRWEDARETLSSTLREAEERHEEVICEHCLTSLALVAIRTGNLVEARGLLDKAMHIASNRGELFAAGLRRYVAALIAIREKAFPAAFENCVEALDCWHDLRSELAALPAIDLAAGALASAGQLASAQCLLQSAKLIRKRRGAQVSPLYRIDHEEAEELSAKAKAEPAPIADATALAEAARRMLAHALLAKGSLV